MPSVRFSGTAARMSQQSFVTLPVLVPPWNVTPWALRTLNVDVDAVEHARVVADVLRRI